MTAAAQPKILLIAEGMFAIGALDLLTRAGLDVRTISPSRVASWLGLVDDHDLVIYETDRSEPNLRRLESLCQRKPLIVASGSSDAVKVFGANSATQPTSVPQDQLVSTVLSLVDRSKKEVPDHVNVENEGERSAII